jgi:hypothetical protein
MTCGEKKCQQREQKTKCKFIAGTAKDIAEAEKGWKRKPNGTLQILLERGFVGPAKQKD